MSDGQNKVEVDADKKPKIKGFNSEDYWWDES